LFNEVLNRRFGRFDRRGDPLGLVFDVLAHSAEFRFELFDLSAKLLA
jgi:hypothetical protein